MLKGLSGRVPPRSRWSAKALFKKALWIFVSASSHVFFYLSRFNSAKSAPMENSMMTMWSINQRNVHRAPIHSMLPDDETNWSLTVLDISYLLFSIE
jgi:hypothetical protein